MRTSLLVGPARNRGGTFGSDTVTLVFGYTMAMEAGGSVNGTIEFPLDGVDENARHADRTATSMTGEYVGMLDPDSVWHITYRFTGEQFYIELNDTYYPATATMGPFMKQWGGFLSWDWRRRRSRWCLREPEGESGSAGTPCDLEVDEVRSATGSMREVVDGT